MEPRMTSESLKTSVGPTEHARPTEDAAPAENVGPTDEEDLFTDK